MNIQRLVERGPVVFVCVVVIILAVFASVVFFIFIRTEDYAKPVINTQTTPAPPDTVFGTN